MLDGDLHGLEAFPGTRRVDQGHRGFPGGVRKEYSKGLAYYRFRRLSGQPLERMVEPGDPVLRVPDDDGGARIGDQVVQVLAGLPEHLTLPDQLFVGVPEFFLHDLLLLVGLPEFLVLSCQLFFGQFPIGNILSLGDGGNHRLPVWAKQGGGVPEHGPDLPGRVADRDLHGLETLSFLHPPDEIR